MGDNELKPNDVVGVRSNIGKTYLRKATRVSRAWRRPRPACRGCAPASSAGSRPRWSALPAAECWALQCKAELLFTVLRAQIHKSKFYSLLGSDRATAYSQGQNGFSTRLPHFFRVQLGFTASTGIYRVLLGFTGFDCALPSGLNSSLAKSNEGCSSATGAGSSLLHGWAHRYNLWWSLFLCEPRTVLEVSPKNECIMKSFHGNEPRAECHRLQTTYLAMSILTLSECKSCLRSEVAAVRALAVLSVLPPGTTPAAPTLGKNLRPGNRAWWRHGGK